MGSWRHPLRRRRKLSQRPAAGRLWVECGSRQRSGRRRDQPSEAGRARGRTRARTAAQRHPTLDHVSHLRVTVVAGRLRTGSRRSRCRPADLRRMQGTQCFSRGGTCFCETFYDVMISRTCFTLNKVENQKNVHSVLLCPLSGRVESIKRIVSSPVLRITQARKVAESSH